MNSKSLPTWLSLLLGLGVTAGLGYLFYRIVVAVLASASSVSSDTSKAIVAAAATVFASVASLTLGKVFEQRTKIREEVRQRKIPIYEEMIRLLFSVVYAEREGRTVDEKEIQKAFRSVTEKILVWGGPDVIRAWAAFRSGFGSNPLAGFVAFEQFVRAMRKELGNSNTLLSHGDLLKTFVNDYDPAKAAALGPPPK